LNADLFLKGTATAPLNSGPQKENKDKATQIMFLILVAVVSCLLLQ